VSSEPDVCCASSVSVRCFDISPFVETTTGTSVTTTCSSNSEFVFPDFLDIFIVFNMFIVLVVVVVVVVIVILVFIFHGL